MNQTESIRGMVTLLAVYREAFKAMLTVFEAGKDNGLWTMVGLTDAALEDAAHYLGAGEVRRIKANAARGAAPHVAELRADPPVKVADIKAERDALTARVAALESALAYYTDATTVKSWGYQELEDIGDVARHALGMPEPSPRELADRLGQPYHETTEEE